MFKDLQIYWIKRNLLNQNHMMAYELTLTNVSLMEVKDKLELEFQFEKLKLEF